MFDVNEALNLDTSKLETEVTGERIVKEIQEWLLSQKKSGGTAVLPEDKTQRLLVGVSYHTVLIIFLTTFSSTTVNYYIPTNLHFQACNQLELACHIEMTASRLRLDAVHLLKTVLVGTNTKNFTDVLEATFGGA